MESGELLVAAQLTSVYPSTQITAIPIQTSRQNAPLPPVPKANDPPVEHAIYSTSLYAPILGTVILRVLHQGLILELLSISNDITIRFVFPSPVLSFPAIFLWQGTELHVIAVTSLASVYRLVLPVGAGTLWHEPFRSNWCREYLIRNVTEPFNGLVHVQGTHCVIIGHKNGSLLRIETEFLGDERLDDEWTENVFQHKSFLHALTSFLPTLHTGPSSSSEIIAMATHPQPTDIGYVWTLSRDRVIRLWSPKSGCVCSKPLASSIGREATPAPGSASSGGKPQILLDEGPQSLLRAFSTNMAGEQLYLLAFVPTPSSATAGGFFQLFKTEDDQLYELGRIDGSTASAHCHLQDFIVFVDSLYVLWDRQGQSAVEKTWLNPDEFNWMDTHHAWRFSSYPEEAELTPAYLDELLLWRGSLTEKFFEAIMRPGMFSTFTLRTALDQYTDVCLSLPGAAPHQLRTTYPTLGENIVAVVGCTVNLLRDPLTGALQYDKYWNALKRDWEGFIARCREVERSARWPLSLGVDGSKGLVLVLERERVACLVCDDDTIRLHRRLAAGHAAHNEPTELMEILWALRKSIGRQAMWLLEGHLVDISHQQVAFTLSDIIKDAAYRVDLKGNLEDGLDMWMDGRIQSVDNLHDAVRSIVDTLGAFDTVKVEVNEDVDLAAPPATHSEWSKTLIASYVAATVHARYELCLTLMVLFFFMPDHNWSPSLLEEAFSVFRGIAMARLTVRQPANPTVRPLNIDTTADDVVARLGNLHVGSQNRSNFVPAHSLLQQLLSGCLHLPNIARAAHLYLDQSGLLQSLSPSLATRHEVAHCHNIAQLGYTEVATQLLDWLPRTAGVTYLRAELLVRAGRADDAAYLFEKLAARFGRDNALLLEDMQALKAMVNVDSDFAFYKHVAFVIFKDTWTDWKVIFSQMALSVAPPNLEKTDLWNAVVDGNIDLGQYDEAYAALVAAPPDPSKGDRVLRLVYSMCESDVVEKLMSYNFAGFSDEVQDALSFKARNVDPRSRPFYSRILYSWFISRGDYRNAALTMYQRARKLHNLIGDPNGLFIVAEEQLEAYLVAINALSLVDRKSAWVALPVQQETGHEPRKRRKLSKHIPEASFGSGKSDAEIVDLADMQYEYALLSARVDLARVDDALILAGEFLLPPESIVLRLVQANRFNYAMATARSLNVDMSDLFAHLTTQCLKLSRTPGVVLQEDTSDWLLTDKVTSWPGTPTDRGWRYLRQSLDRHDNVETDYKYSKVTLETILAFDRFWPTPPWLIQTLEEHDHEYLIRTALRYEIIETALKHTISLLRKADAELASGVKKSALSTWLPYTLIDQVVAAADQDDVPPAAKALQLELKNDLKSRIKRMEKLSNRPR